MFEHFWAFIDEFGNENLDVDTPGVSNFFIVTAVIVEDSGLEILNRSIESIRRVYFQKGEMKSFGVGNDHIRRMKILESLAKTNIKYITMVINKNEIDKTSGLGYKKSFRKFLPGLIYSRLYKTFPNMTVISDKHGRDSFMKSVHDYVQNRKKVSLFEEQTFEFADSKDYVLIQAADFISGTWGKILDPIISIDICSQFKDLVKEKAIFVDNWPPSPHSIFAKTDVESYLNNVVRQQCYQLVQQYIADNVDTTKLNEDDAAEMELRLAALRYLLYQNDVLENDEFIYAKRIISYLKSINQGELTPRRFASSVISPLRDRGVIIASGTKGYRIPTTVQDIIEFARTTGEKVVPMVARLGIARDQILLASNKSLDIVAESGFEIMNSFIEIQRESPLPYERDSPDTIDTPT